MKQSADGGPGRWHGEVEVVASALLLVADIGPLGTVSLTLYRYMLNW